MTTRPTAPGRSPTLWPQSPESEGRVHVLHRPGKEGLGRAYLAGFAWALARGYDAVVEMDADLSHDPLYLQSMVEAAQDAGCGHRLALSERHLGHQLAPAAHSAVLGRELVCPDRDAADRQ